MPPRTPLQVANAYMLLDGSWKNCPPVVRLQFHAVIGLADILGLSGDWLLTGKGGLYHPKMKLNASQSRLMAESKDLFLAAAEIDPTSPTFETQVFGNKGLAACYFDEAPAFNPDEPFPLEHCPRAAPYHLFNRAMRLLTGLAFQANRPIRNMRVTADPELQVVSTTMTPDEFKKLARRLAGRKTRDRQLHVYELRLYG